MSDKAKIYAEGLSRLVQIPTVTGVDRKSFAAFRKELAAQFPGVYSACEVIMPGGEESDAIMFKWKGRSSSRPLVLMAHQDVVPAEGKWKYPPFSGTVADGKVWGRGSMDCKNTLYCTIRSVEELIGEGFTPEQDVYLCYSDNEETSGHGATYCRDWLTGLGFNMGIVLILITLLLKVITYPLVKKSYMSSAKMRVLRPKIEEATKQYDKPEDQMMKQQAMMSMYAKYGVSPLSGCLPVLIQMPIWVAMFNFVPNAIQLRGESFLWINDLSTYDPIIEWNRNIWLIGDHLSLTCILFCVANVLYSIMSMRQQRDQMVGQQAEQMKMMQWMMYLMPVMFFFIFNDYSAGLNFYYFVSLFFSAAIMWLLRKTTNDEKLLAILEARYQENKNNPKKMSGMAARLEELQRQAAEMQKMREQGKKK